MDANVAREILNVHQFLLGKTNLRLDKYRQAIEKRVKPGNTVLDLGTGTGILAFFACLTGARRVYALESGSVISLAKLLARENGFEDRIVFLAGASAELDLPEQVDVIITDTVDFFVPDTLRSIQDARHRWLRPSGSLIPTSMELFVAPVEAREIYARQIDSWNSRRYGIDFSIIRQFAINQCYPADVSPADLLADAASMATLSLPDLTSVAFDGEVSATAQRSGTLHGLCLWSASDLADGITLSNRPGATTTNYSQLFLPVAQPIPVNEGDGLKIRVRSYDSFHWRWQVETCGTDSGRAQSTVRFDHSTFQGFPLSAEVLRKIAPDHEPRLSARGQAEHLVLSLSNGETAIADLEQQIGARYPNLFRSKEDVTSFVAEIIARCA
jgi:SAM-dependent methyltransferase